VLCLAGVDGQIHRKPTYRQRLHTTIGVSCRPAARAIPGLPGVIKLPRIGWDMYSSQSGLAGIHARSGTCEPRR
jgi:hypothetical protein